jgi:alkyl hydroperoxide reductase subunit AhpF
MNGPAVPATIREPGRKIPISGRYDVVICGGGAAGVAAALASARFSPCVACLTTQRLR